MTRHLNRLRNLSNKYSKSINHTSFVKRIVHNMSSFTLIEHEYNTLVFGLDHHIPTRTKENIIDTEFELYSQSINCYVNEIPDNKISHLKTKLRTICERYNRIHVPYKFRKIVEKLSRNKITMVLKKRHGQRSYSDRWERKMS